MTTIHDVQLIEIPKNSDRRGNLSVIEGNLIPFETKRVLALTECLDVRIDCTKVRLAWKVRRNTEVKLAAGKGSRSSDRAGTTNWISTATTVKFKITT